MIVCASQSASLTPSGPGPAERDAAPERASASARFRSLGWVAAHACACAIAAIAVWLRPADTKPAKGGTAVTFARAHAIVQARCAPCHSMNPTQPGFISAPAGVVLDTPEQIHALAAQIKAVAVDSTFMPLGNATRMTGDERTALGQWIAAGAKIQP